MPVKPSVAAARRKKRLWALIVLLVLFLSAVLFVKAQKKMLVREGAAYLRGVLSHRMGINLQIAKISGSLLGELRLDNVRVMDRVEQVSQRVLFKAKSIRVRFSFLDFISKKFNNKIDVVVDRPEIYWRPYISLRRSPYPFLGWMRGWALSGRRHLRIRAEGLCIHADWLSIPLRDIRVDYDDNTVEAEIPIRHLSLAAYDVSSALKINGTYEPGIMGKSDAVIGTVLTEGSVVNWSPVSEESKIEFCLTREALEVVSSRIVGGLAMSGRIDLAHDYELLFKLRADNFAFSNFSVLFSASQMKAMPARINFDLTLWGDPLAPHLSLRSRVEEGFIGKRAFKAFELNLDGIYPTVSLTDSRILLKDGSVMRLANKTLEVRELLSEQVYNTLVSEAKQDTVVWGDWQFKRPRADLDDSEFLVQRLLGDDAKVQFREFKEQFGPDWTVPEEQKTEIGFEYRLLSKNALKVGVSQDERYVGIERKMRF
ncbi:MAG: hypothetical protein WCG06_03430 [Candidatus Omnitrophota bacterium]